MPSLPIITERLLVRAFSPNDAVALAAYRGKPEVARFQSWQEYSINQAHELIAEMESSSPDTKGKWFQFAIELQESAALIGDIGFLNTDGAGKSWIGFSLDPHYWCRGFATEAVGAVIDYYLDQGITTVWASTDPANLASRRLLRRLGFELIEENDEDAIYRRSGRSEGNAA